MRPNSSTPGGGAPGTATACRYVRPECLPNRIVSSGGSRVGQGAPVVRSGNLRDTQERDYNRDNHTRNHGGNYKCQQSAQPTTKPTGNAFRTPSPTLPVFAFLPRFH